MHGTRALEVLPGPARDVFLRRYGWPTPAQALAWPAIVAGRNALVIAPTGSGKTLAAFYAFLARMALEPPPEGAPGIEIVYVSPLKALAADVEKNLRAPLASLREDAHRRGGTWTPVPVAVRSGDTPATERAAMRRRPPRILVTTPESLYLLLTSPRSRAALTAVRAVIVDEIHALLATKRGVHLALSLERLENLAGAALQRIGLSATVRPHEEAARFLAGYDGNGRPRPVEILDAGGRKSLDLRVLAATQGGSPLATAGPGGVWPHVARELLEIVRAHRSTLVFCNSRRLAERITALVNEAAGRPVALAHHGSVSRERRQELEARLKAGKLPALVATGSLELGIDIGAIDCVVQIESPRSVARGLQRVGRSGHLLGATAKGRIFVTHRADALEAAAVACAMREPDLEPTRVPERCLDVLAQQIVAEVAAAGRIVSARELHAAFSRAAPYRSLSWEEFAEVLDLLAGRWGGVRGGALRDLAPRLDWDRRRGRLAALPGSRAIATARPGAIPDRGLYRVELEETRARLGELDEEFVHESRVGDVFVLGTTSFRIVRILRDRVIVRPAAPGEPARMPFWRGEGLGRSSHLGERVGRLIREIAALLGEAPSAAARARAQAFVQETCAVAPDAAAMVVDHVARQREVAGVVPDDRTIVIEQFDDELGDARVAILSPFGGRVHAAWAIALSGELRRRTGASGGTDCGYDAPYVAADDGILFRAPGPIAERLLDAGTLAASRRSARAAGRRDRNHTALRRSLPRGCAARAPFHPARTRSPRSPVAGSPAGRRPGTAPPRPSRLPPRAGGAARGARGRPRGGGAFADPRRDRAG